MERYLYKTIIEDLKRKMVFVTGPRQVGKTYLAKQIMSEFAKPQYLNYDATEDRNIILKQSWNINAGLLVLDEIHKMKNWKSFLKGVYDSRAGNQSILVTGSARMETFRQSGESLAGRYFHHRLYPLSVKELKGQFPAFEAIERLSLIGGFPEPFLAESKNPPAYAARWRNQYYTDLVREDILEFSRINEIKDMRHLVELLRNRVGSKLSYKSIAEDLQLAPNTVKKYIGILESLYIIFLIKPYHKNIARAILKEPKIYFFDSGYIKGNEGLRFENTCALSLLNHVHHLNDANGENISLNYLRTKDGKEIDFVLCKKDEAASLIEIKLSDANVSKHFSHFLKIFPPAEAIQLVHNLKQEKHINNVQVLKAGDWLVQLSI